MRIIDGDGHVVEDFAAIEKFLPADLVRMGALRAIFPPLDHFHTFVGQTPPGSFRRDVGPAEWLEFLDDLGIESTVLYPTVGLAYGRIFHCDWAIAACRAYNDWIHAAVSRPEPALSGGCAHPDAGAGRGGQGAAPRRARAGLLRRDAALDRPARSAGRQGLLAGL